MFALFNLDLLKSKRSIMENGHSTKVSKKTDHDNMDNLFSK